MLYNEVRLGVKGSTPLFGDLRDSGHQEGASFLLFLREAAAPPAAKQQAEAQPPKATFKLEKAFGTLRVETTTSARLFLDEVFQGEVPAGRTAVIENLEAGSHLLEMWYEDEGYESREVAVARDTVTEVSFSYEKSEPPTLPAAGPAKPDPVLKPLDPIPTATIKIDGKFEDWQNIPPALTDGQENVGSMDIERVYLARDSKYIYTRVDLYDRTPTSLGHPHNFDAKHMSHYHVTVHLPGSVMLELSLVYNYYSSSKAWFTQIGKNDLGKWELVARAGSHSMRGSSCEARYPLSAVRKYVAEGEIYPVSCTAGWVVDGKWMSVDFATLKVLQF
jgi:hypothetical protein